VACPTKVAENDPDETLLAEFEDADRLHDGCDDGGEIMEADIFRFLFITGVNKSSFSKNWAVSGVMTGGELWADPWANPAMFE